MCASSSLNVHTFASSNNRRRFTLYLPTIKSRIPSKSSKCFKAGKSSDGNFCSVLLSLRLQHHQHKQTKVLFPPVQSIASITFILKSLSAERIVYDLCSSYVFDLDVLPGNFFRPFVACKIQMSLYGAETTTKTKKTSKSQTVQVDI